MRASEIAVGIGVILALCLGCGSNSGEQDPLGPPAGASVTGEQYVCQDVAPRALAKAVNLEDYSGVKWASRVEVGEFGFWAWSARFTNGRVAGWVVRAGASPVAVNDYAAELTGAKRLSGITRFDNDYLQDPDSRRFLLGCQIEPGSPVTE